MSERADSDAEVEAENERLRKKLGLSELEWALSGGFAEQRTQTRPSVIPGLSGKSDEEHAEPPAKDGGPDVSR
ncbi:MAG TPA: hypothetical protein VGE42_02365 [Candidatus Dormibacteraeota bacterium]|jgi:hypothetical protein